MACLQYISVFLIGLFLRARFSVEVKGVEHIDGLRSPFIIAANHPSRIDPLLLCLLPPSCTSKIIPVRFMMAEIYFENVFLRYLLTPLGAYRINRWALSLEEYMQKTVEVLKRGQNVLIFPEGKLSPKNIPQQGKPGIVYAATEAKCDIIPLHIEYKGNKKLLRTRIELTIGNKFIINSPVTNVKGCTSEALRLVDYIYKL